MSDHHHHDHSCDHSHDAASPYSHPVLAAILNEALALLGEGAPANAVEAAALAAGMPTGALAALDAVSLEVVDHALHAELHDLEHGHGAGHEEPAHVHGPHCNHAHDDHGHGHHHGHEHEHAHDHGHDHAHDHAPAHDHAAHGDEPAKHAHAVKSRAMTEAAVYVMEKMAHGFKRMGRAAGRGFYDYEFDTPELWSGLKTFERRSTKLPAQDMSDRLAFAAVLAGLSLPDPATHLPAIAPLIGHALPSDHKQALTWARALGESRFSTRCAELSAQYGERFTMPRARDAQAVVQIHRKHSH